MEYKISKESVERAFPKKDIAITGWESPIEVVMGQLRTSFDEGLEDERIRAIQEYGITVDKDELIKALQYDRNQYESGFAKGYTKGYEQGVRDYAQRVKKYYTSLSGKTMTAVVKYVLTVIEQEMLKADRGDANE